MRSLNLKTLTLCLIVCLGSAAHAMSCKSFLTQAAENDSLNPLEKLQIQIDQAKTLQEASDLTYDKVVTGNMIFDQAIDGIIALNTQTDLDPQSAQNMSSQVQAIISALQDAFGIPSYIMGFAISNRLELESAEALAVLKAEQAREPIGFVQNNVSDAEPTSTKQPIGFVINKKSEAEQDKSENFFDHLIESLKEQAANQNAPAKKVFGFLTPKSNQADDQTPPLKQIGFVHTKTEEKAFTADDLPKVVLNVKKGEFRIGEDKNKTKLGFTN